MTIKKSPTTHVRHLTHRINLASATTAEKRSKICKDCADFDAKNWECRTAKDFMPLKWREISGRCPSGLWGASWGEE
jgi:hypothetical protein